MNSLDPATDSGKVAMGNLLFIDAEMALCLARMARDTTDPTIRKRRFKAAEKAYYRIIAFIPRVSLTAHQMASLEKQLCDLQIHLKDAPFGSRTLKT